MEGGGLPGVFSPPEGCPWNCGPPKGGQLREAFACLFRMCAVLPHQACADGSVFFCRRLPRAGLSGCAHHMPLVPDPSRPVRTGAGGGGIGNRCPARYWGRPCVPSPSTPYSSMNLRRMSSDAASGFPSLFITVILRMPVMALAIFCSVTCTSCCCASILR